ncbi:hypothetical protein GII32_01230 [Gordonia amarae]|uniref:reverse transcriptase domain-containing protein n=1 Tax=Gordonia amarae TaxID=36821 RepID=UPI001AF571C4|nr:reverse transcriptase domain-containing protein [Gordonia amarae]QHN29208.1 hypothetical protein GII32_01230 [Gordonia amarae]
MEHNISVNEAALRTGKSVATVRRLLAAGKLSGEKICGHWVVHADRLPSSPAGPSVSASGPKLDSRAAIRFLMKTDRKELWIPDVLNWEDVRADPSSAISVATGKCSTGQADPFETVEVPKGPLLSRAGVLLSFEDRLAYQMLCAVVAPQIDAVLAERVFSSRLNKRPGSFFVSPFNQYKLFIETVETVAGSTKWVVSTDLVSYFETISHELLFEDLRDLRVRDEIMRPLRLLLGSWRRASRTGLPVGPDASRLLGNFFLNKIDQQMLEEGFDYYRYMDDVRIVVSSEREGRAALRRFEVLCRARGLIVTGTAKSKIEKSDPDSRVKDDAQFEWIEYAMRNSLDESRKVLREMFSDALSEKVVKRRHARFALIRLGKLVDRRVLAKVLRRLEELSEVSKDSVYYLRSFISERHVQTAITKYLERPEEPGLEKYQEAWLIAVMLEVLNAPPAEWISYARRIAWDANQPTYLRNLAFNLVALGHDPRDIERIVEIAESNYESSLVRGAIVALARVQKFSRRTQGSVLARHPALKGTVEYLKQRRSLPSLVQEGLWNTIKSAP